MKKLVDIATLVLLVVAFGVAFYAGFIAKRDGTDIPLLKTTLFALISSIGSIALIVVGAVNALAERVKRNYITRSFVWFAVAQAAALLGMLTIMFLIGTQMISIDAKLVWALYIIFVLVIIAGYADSVAFTDKLEEIEAPADGIDEAAEE